MKRRNTHRNRTSGANTGDFATVSWKYLLISIVGAVAIASGLFFAATRHFSSMELGLMNAKLRNQLQELKNEKRRLELEREVAMTPTALKRTARSLGFSETAMLTKSAEPSAAELTETKSSLAGFGGTDSNELTNLAGKGVIPKVQIDPDKKIVATVARQEPAKEKGGETKPDQANDGSQPRIVTVADRSIPKETNGIQRTAISMPTTRSSQSRTLVKFD